jgi:phosphoenolpyruvate phosphomutase
MDCIASRLRTLVESPGLTFLMEAHNGLSARIVEEAGFEAIWASGLTLSASQGVRDSNEASWTQVLEAIEFMADATHIPILVDGDTGHGNFNNVRRFVTRLENRGAAGVCLEDKHFPKTNSFVNAEQQALADIEEFSGRIKAAKDALHNDQFVIVARTEALVAGLGCAEALARAEAYWRAGADAILIHSAKSDASEVFEFKRRWGSTLPVIAVPTRYHATPTDAFRAHGFSVVIWANHLLRAAITAMQTTAARLFADQCLAAVEPAIATLEEVFRLQNLDELLRAEARYLPDRLDSTLQRIA